MTRENIFEIWCCYLLLVSISIHIVNNKYKQWLFVNGLNDALGMHSTLLYVLIVRAVIKNGCGGVGTSLAPLQSSKQTKATSALTAGTWNRGKCTSDLEVFSVGILEIYKVPLIAWSLLTRLRIIIVDGSLWSKWENFTGKSNLITGWTWVRSQWKPKKFFTQKMWDLSDLRFVADIWIFKNWIWI